MSRAKKSSILAHNTLLEKRYEADVKRLAALGNQIKGNMSLSDFAARLGYPVSTISRFLSGTNSTASSDELIVALAVNRPTDCGVSFRNLINAQGYYLIDDEKCSDFDELLENYYNLFVTVASDYALLKSEKINLQKESEERAQSIVQSFLINRGYAVKKQMANREEYKNVVMNDVYGFYRADFILETDALEHFNINKWAFKICCNTAMSDIETKLLRLFASAYLEHPLDAGYRITFVVGEKAVFQRLRMMMESWADKGIHDSISLMLIDFSKNEVVAEYVMTRDFFADNFDNGFEYQESIIGDEIDKKTSEFIPKLDMDDFSINLRNDPDLFARFNMSMDDDETEVTE